MAAHEVTVCHGANLRRSLWYAQNRLPHTRIDSMLVMDNRCRRRRQYCNDKYKNSK